MTQEILQALRNIEDKIMREPTAFNWTPSMDAIWPRDMRPTMSGLLAIWAAMHEAAVYAEADASTSPKPLADDGWIEWGGGDRPVSWDTPVDVKLRDGMEKLDYEAEGYDGDEERGFAASWWKHQGAWFDIVAWRPAK